MKRLIYLVFVLFCTPLFSSEKGCLLSDQIQTVPQIQHFKMGTFYKNFFKHDKCLLGEHSKQYLNLQDLTSYYHNFNYTINKIKETSVDPFYSPEVRQMLTELGQEIENEKLESWIFNLLAEYGDEPGQYKFTERLGTLFIKGQVQGDSISADCLKRDQEKCILYNIVRKQQNHEYVIHRFSDDPSYLRKLRKYLRRNQHSHYNSDAVSNTIGCFGLFFTATFILAPIGIPMMVASVPLKVIEQAAYPFIKKNAQVLKQLIKGENAKLSQDRFDDLSSSFIYAGKINPHHWENLVEFTCF